MVDSNIVCLIVGIAIGYWLGKRKGQHFLGLVSFGKVSMKQTNEREEKET